MYWLDCLSFSLPKLTFSMICTRLDYLQCLKLIIKKMRINPVWLIFHCHNLILEKERKRWKKDKYIITWKQSTQRPIQFTVEHLPTCRWIGGRWLVDGSWVGGVLVGGSVVGGSMEHLSLGRWLVVGGLVEDLSMGWRSVGWWRTYRWVGVRLSVVDGLSVVGGFVISLTWNTCLKIWKNMLYKGEYICAIFLDLPKTFGTITHYGLTWKYNTNRNNI